MGLTDRIDMIRNYLKNNQHVLSAVLYGSSNFDDGRYEDVDIAVMVPSSGGVCDFGIYSELRRIRQELSKLLGGDVDLVPHTEDEITRPISPLTFPKYNSSLVFGIPVKGRFPVSIPSNSQTYTQADLAEWVMSDTRTITRRQILRPTGEEEIRIFISKLAHGPGNFLTMWALKEGCQEHKINPSDFKNSFEIFGEITGVEINPILHWIRVLKKGIKEGYFSPEDAFPLITWYENMFRSAISEDFSYLRSYMNRDLRLPGVLLILKNTSGEILLIKRENKEGISHPSCWFLPSETIETETPYEAAVRGAQEELGLSISPKLIAKQKMRNGTPRFIYSADIPHESHIYLNEGERYGFFSRDQLDRLDLPEAIYIDLDNIFSMNKKENDFVYNLSQVQP